MNSNKPQGVTTTGKRKFSLFNLRKTNGPGAPNKNESATAAAEVIDTALSSVVQPTNGTASHPSTSQKAQIKKITKFFKKGTGVSTKKATKTANAAAPDHEKQFSESEGKASPGQADTTQSVPAEQNDASFKAGDSEVDENIKLRREKAATKIQAIFRGHKERLTYIKKRRNVIKIEALVRGFLARKHAADKKPLSDNSTTATTTTTVTEEASNKGSPAEIPSERDNVITLN